MGRKKLITLVALLALAAAACAPGGGIGATDPPAVPEATGPGDPFAGAEIYRTSCSACHGSNLEGTTHLGTPLAPSDFVTSKTEQELADFTEKGREADDPASVMGRLMPPKGGNRSLTPQDLLDVAAFMHAQN